MDAARELLDAAVERFLGGRSDIVVAVLAGSAEDVLQGLLRHEGRAHESARESILDGAAIVFDALGHTEHPYSRGEAFKHIRREFNWARHFDRAHDPIEITADWHETAVWALARALANFLTLTGQPHPKALQVDAAMAREN